MATYDYSKIAATALALLEKFGTTVTLSRKTGAKTDPVTGAVTAGTDATVTTTGLIKPYKDNLIDGARILQGDMELVLSNEQEPLMTDTPSVNGENWSVVGIKTIKPDNATPVCWFVQVRK